MSVMRRIVHGLVVAVLAAVALAQDAAPVAASVPKLSAAARAAIGAARELAGKARGMEGAELKAALQSAAAAYEKAAQDCANEPPAAAQATFAAAELWRRHESFTAAERAFLDAARLDTQRYGQRGKLGAADMQRRQDRLAEALASYAEAAAIEPTTARAQTARLWQARLLQDLGRSDESIAAFRSAVASANTAPQVIEASNQLACALLEQGQLDEAGRAIEHAESVSRAIEDPQQREHLLEQCESMSARRSLQRARDKAANAGADAAGVESSRTLPRADGPAGR